MRFVQFGTYVQNRFAAALGTHASYKPDNKLDAVRFHQDAVRECVARGYQGFQYYEGPNILDAKPYGYPADCRQLAEETRDA